MLGNKLLQFIRKLETRILLILISNTVGDLITLIMLKKFIMMIYLHVLYL